MSWYNTQYCLAQQAMSSGRFSSLRLARFRATLKEIRAEQQKELSKSQNRKYAKIICVRLDPLDFASNSLETETILSVFIGLCASKFYGRLQLTSDKILNMIK